MARLLRCAVLTQWLLAGVGLLAGWSWSPLGASLLAFHILFGYAFVLAWEYVMLRRVNRTDPTPPATWAALVRAWGAETLLAPRVFCWWQPFFSRRVPDACAPGSAPGRRGVVLVHGFACNRGLWMPWLRALRADGRAFVAVNLEPVFGSIDSYAPLLGDAVARVTAATGLAPVLVCHSMGGLAARAWLRTPGAGRADERVHHVVTLGTPHRGAWAAQFSHTVNGRQMRLDSGWLRELAGQEPADRAALFTCWYSNGDNVVFPASSATLPGARNRHLPGLAHLELALSEVVLRATLESLRRDDWATGP